jgi:hypothetical protein
MVGEIVTASMLHGLTVRTTLDPTEQGFLTDHRQDGKTALFPGVMYMESFAEVSRLMVPDWHVVAVENLVIPAGLKFFRDEPRTVTITSLLRPEPGNPDVLIAECALASERLLPGSDRPQQTVHARAQVRLAPRPLAPDKRAKPALSSKTSLTPEQVYSVYFHGPSYRVLQSVWRLGGTKQGAVGRFAEDLPPSHSPVEAPLLIGPRLAELCYQTAGMWEMGHDGRYGLPSIVTSFRVYGTPTEDTPLVCTARPTEHGFDCVVQRKDGTVVVEMTGYRTVALPDSLPADQAEMLGAVMAD